MLGKGENEVAINFHVQIGKFQDDAHVSRLFLEDSPFFSCVNGKKGKILVQCSMKSVFDSVFFGNVFVCNIDNTRFIEDIVREESFCV